MVPWSSFMWGRSSKDAAPSPQAPPEKEATALTVTTPPTAVSPAEKATQAPITIDPAVSDPSMFSRRSLRQLGLFFGGATLVALSVMVSRRAVIRHTTAARLRYYQQNQNHWGEQFGGKSTEKNDKDPTVAFEALNLATLNVASFAIMALGGLSFAFDISSVDELRVKARRTLFEGSGPSEVDAAAEKEVAEWVSKVLKVQFPKDASTDKAKQQGDKKPSSE